MYKYWVVNRIQKDTHVGAHDRDRVGILLSCLPFALTQVTHACSAEHVADLVPGRDVRFP